MGQFTDRPPASLGNLLRLSRQTATVPFIEATVSSMSTFKSGSHSTETSDSEDLLDKVHNTDVADDCCRPIVDHIPDCMSSNSFETTMQVDSASLRDITRSLSLSSRESILTVLVRHPSFVQNSDEDECYPVASPRQRRALARHFAADSLKSMPELDDRIWFISRRRSPVCLSRE